jgi:DNA processing protein
MMNEKEALVFLNLITDMGGITMRRLVERFGSAAAVPGLRAAQLAEVHGIGLEKSEWFAKQFAEARAAGQPELEMARAERMKVDLVTWADPAYPKLLMEIPDPPLTLYTRGDTRLLKRKSVAVVGTRRATLYGMETSKRFAYGLSMAGYCVVSGLARGIDREAHEGALQAKGATVAVIGAALDKLYPPENEELARRIVEGGGAVVSEYPFGRQADRQTFPMRNRIVAGLCKGIVVVESPAKSGTLITAGQAVEFGRSVMVVPGRIDAPGFEGSHRLIRDGATLVTSVEDAMEGLENLFNRRATSGAPSEVAERQVSLSPDEQKILDALAGSDGGCPVDVIAGACNIPAHKITALLVGLEMKRVARVLPGGLVTLAGKA